MTHKANKTTYGASVVVREVVSEPDLRQMLNEIHQLTKGSHSPKIYIDLADVTQFPKEGDVSDFLKRLGNEKEALNAKDVIITLPKIAPVKAQFNRLIARSKLNPKTFCDANQAISSLFGKGRESKA